MKVVVIGTGYVGLVTGTCFAEMGNEVVCVDINQAKIDGLRNGVIPIYEPGLEDLVERNTREGRLSFSTSLSEALPGAVACFIAVGTPSGKNGEADLSHVLSVAKSIGEHIEEYLVVVDKSTVPVGTAEQAADAIAQAQTARGTQVPFDVVSNPEFLAEGAAIDDFMRPDRVIVGTDSERAVEILSELYAPFCRSEDKLLVMGIRDAEMTKYAANAMLATRISFMNEIANICEHLGVDVEMVRRGIGSDSRIGKLFLYPGCGYGGSCFPKDVKALVHTAEQAGFEPTVLHAVEARNMAQKRILFEKLTKHIGALRGKTIALWGLAFKPGTDDMREAPSLVLIEQLLSAGARVRAFDPVASQTAVVAMAEAGLNMNAVEIVTDQYDALVGASALVLVTEWKQFRQPDFQRIAQALGKGLIVDGRNQYDPATVKRFGLSYAGIGH